MAVGVRRPAPSKAAVRHVDGHVRADQATRLIGETYVPRSKLPAWLMVENSWTSDAAGYPLLVVLAETGCLAGARAEALVDPELRAMAPDHRRALVGFDRCGGLRRCSPTWTRPASTP